MMQLVRSGESCADWTRTHPAESRPTDGRLFGVSWKRRRCSLRESSSTLRKALKGLRSDMSHGERANDNDADQLPLFCAWPVGRVGR